MNVNLFKCALHCTGELIEVKDPKILELADFKAFALAQAAAKETMLRALTSSWPLEGEGLVQAFTTFANSYAQWESINDCVFPLQILDDIC